MVYFSINSMDVFMYVECIKRAVAIKKYMSVKKRTFNALHTYFRNSKTIREIYNPECLYNKKKHC